MKIMKKSVARMAPLLLLLLAMLLMSTMVGCGKSTAPGANIAGGVYKQSGYTLMKWEEGLAIMIWHDAIAASNSHGSSSTGSSVYTLKGHAESKNGTRVEWDLETSDGKTAQFIIDNTNYDLSEGALFIISTKTGTITIMQLNRDLSDVQPEYDSCVAFGENDLDVADFLMGNSNE
jgi:hypothetical protein